MGNIKEKLEKCGLTKNESKIYHILLIKSPIKAQDISKKSNINRSLVYQVLNILINKGLVNYITKEHIKYFSASNPNNLLSVIEEKRIYIKSILPELQELEKIKEIEQDVQVYEGKAGIKSLLTELLNSKTIDFFGATGELFELLKFYLPRILKELKKKKISCRAIGDQKAKSKFIEQKTINFKSIKNVESYNSPTVIFKDSIGIISLKTEKPLIIIIKNTFITKTYQNYFNFIWKLANKN